MTFIFLNFLTQIGLITKPKDPYWIGMVIYRSVNDNDRIVGASWMDGSAVDYGHPVKGVDTKPWSVMAQPDNFWKSKPENCVQMYRGAEFPVGNKKCIKIDLSIVK